MFKSLDELNSILIEDLKGIEGVISYEDNRNNVMVLSFQLSSIQTKISYPTNGYGLSDLLKDSKIGCCDEVSKNFNEVLMTFSNNGLENDLQRILK